MAEKKELNWHKQKNDLQGAVWDCFRRNGALSKNRIVDFGTEYWFWSARSVWRAQRPNIVAPVISVTFTGIIFFIYY